MADRLEPLHEEIAALQSKNEALTQQLAVATYPKIPRGLDRVCKAWLSFWSNSKKKLWLH